MTPEMTKKTAFRLLRGASGMTVAVAASELSVDADTVRNWESPENPAVPEDINIFVLCVTIVEQLKAVDRVSISGDLPKSPVVVPLALSDDAADKMGYPNLQIQNRVAAYDVALAYADGLEFRFDEKNNAVT